MTAVAIPVGEISERPPLADVLAELAHLLPQQAPLHAFVHHNTLHAFEDMVFEEAVVHAAQILDTQPFQSEAEFARHLQSGRILPQDLEASIASAFDDDGDPLLLAGLSRSQFRFYRLNTAFDVPSESALQYQWEEGELDRFHSSVTPKRAQELRGAAAELGFGTDSRSGEEKLLRKLWQDLLNAAPTRRASKSAARRRRDQLLAVTAVDTDELVHPPLIRMSAAFLDQGVAYWTMPERSGGFLQAVRRLYGLRLPAPDRALRGLAVELRRQEAEAWDAEKTVSWALDTLEVPDAERVRYIRESLLSLRGWAGMMRQLEERPDRAPVEAPPASLADFLAVRLVLDAVVARNVLRQHFGDSAAFCAAERLAHTSVKPRIAPDVQLVYEGFVLAQCMPVELKALHDGAGARRWLREVAGFDELERRKVLHLAYERRHRVDVLDGLAAHCHLSQTSLPVPIVQAVFCIDDREESLRRHLEESFPQAETYGYAGFFGVAMDYQGIDDVRPRPLCPVTIRPQHLVVETAVEDLEQHAYRRRRRRFGVWNHSVAVASKTLTRGSVFSMVFGMVALVPLVLRSLFPHLAQAWVHAFERRVAPKPRTQLLFERTIHEMSGGQQRGYTIEEMVGIVESVLRTMNLVQNFCPVVLLVGHGSSSLNNPHEAAHDCGATGGGRGGPNARVFAAMANHAEVRAALALRDLEIPESTWFVGAYHNTCDDTVTYYDEHLAPSTHAEKLRTIKAALANACMLDAHERCRRFETAPALQSVSSARACALVHANDLAEPRPEYGHATNAVCIVGRRQRTRGLFLDRRAFLVSYDPTSDPEAKVLTSLLLSVGPVGAGINLEYYFSFVDPVGYGCGTKLPHNITGLIGVMDGHATDLRTGLPWQMVEIHEPVRLLTIVEAKRETLESILRREASLAQLVNNRWIQLVGWDPDSDDMWVFDGAAFVNYEPERHSLPIVRSSVEHYAGERGHLPLAHVQAAVGGVH